MRRKKWIRAFLLAGIALVIALPASAQLVVIEEEPEVELKYAYGRVKLGFFMPSNEYVSNTYGTGFTVGLDYFYPLPYRSYGFMGELDYSSMSRSAEGVDKDWSVTSVGGSFLYFPTRTKEVYIGGGLGYYFMEETIKIGETESSERKRGVGFHLRGGYDLGRFFRNFFVEVKISFAGSVKAGGLKIVGGWKF